MKCSIVLALLLTILLVPSTFALDLTYDDLNVEETNSAEKTFSSQLERDSRAIRYLTDQMDLLITEDGGSFNGKAFTWKKSENFIGIFANSHESTSGDYSGLANPGIYITTKDNFISISSNTKKSVISFHPDCIRVNTKSRAWLLIIPFPSTSSSETIPLDSIEAYEDKLIAVLRELIEEQPVVFDMGYYQVSQIPANEELAQKIDAGTFDFEAEFEKMNKKRKALYQSHMRRKVLVSFYKACQSHLNFEQVRKLDRLAYYSASGDYMVYEWAVKQELNTDELLRVRRILNNSSTRDKLIMHFIDKHSNQISQKDLKRLQRCCYYSENRDRITMMLD